MGGGYQWGAMQVRSGNALVFEGEKIVVSCQKANPEKIQLVNICSDNNNRVFFTDNGHDSFLSQ